MLCHRLDLERRGARIARPAHRAEPDAAQRRLMDQLIAEIARGGTSPSPLSLISENLTLHPDAIHWLLEQGELVRIGDDYCLAMDVFRDLVRKLIAHVATKEDGVITPGEFKELSGLTRKNAIPFLEYLDSVRITVRKADGRAIRDRPEWVDIS